MIFSFFLKKNRPLPTPPNSIFEVKKALGADLDLVSEWDSIGKSSCLIKKSLDLSAQMELEGPPRHKVFGKNMYGRIPNV